MLYIFFHFSVCYKGWYVFQSFCLKLDLKLFVFVCALAAHVYFRIQSLLLIFSLHLIPCCSCLFYKELLLLSITFNGALVAQIYLSSLYLRSTVFFSPCCSYLCLFCLFELNPCCLSVLFYVEHLLLLFI